MEKIILFLTNSWTISIITGLIVFFTTDFVKRYRSKKEYYQNVDLANQEMLNTLKILIPDQELPEPLIIKAMHLSTSRKYKVKLQDMGSLMLILDDLIKEIMDTSFLTYKNKVDYCNEVNQLKVKYQQGKNEKSKVTTDKTKRENETRHSMYHERRVLSLLLTSFFAIFSVALVYMFTIRDNRGILSIFDLRGGEEIIILFPIMIILLMMIGVLYSFQILRRKERDEKYKRDIKKYKEINERKKAE